MSTRGRGPWRDPVPGEQCNFHKDVPAVAVFAGTPLCGVCLPATRPEEVAARQAEAAHLRGRRPGHGSTPREHQSRQPRSPT
ncbi:MAG TPA: hypothetical protein VFR97_07790 [Capillimicrobium sp.]|nr:hypothetical protein [Capillimicrobium sp.]